MSKQIRNPSALASCNCLRIGHWNIEGVRSRILGDKCQLEEVISIIKQHEIFGLTEIHADDSTAISIPGYVCFKSCRKKHPKAKKMSGGTAVLVKKEIAHLITIIKSKHSDIVWVKIPNTHSRHTRDIYLGYVYISPSCSTYTQSQDQDTWDILNEEVSLYQRKGACMLMGDFNARIGTEADYIENEDNRFNQIPTNFITDTNNIPRFNRDSTHNAYKEKLLDLCIASGQRILNGRTIGDCFGELTCHKRNGSSTIDFGLINSDLINKVNSFQVGEFQSEISDHCPISVSVRLPIRRSPVKRNKSKVPAPVKLIWNEETEQRFVQNISSHEFKQEINSLSTEQINECNIDQIIDKGVKLLCRAASVKVKINMVKKTGKRKNKAWFTKDCAVLRSHLRAATKVFTKNPFQRNARDTVFTLKKQYKRTMRKKKQDYKNTLINKLEQMAENNPQEYWKIVEKLRETETESIPDSIEETEWLSHYKKLFRSCSDPMEDRETQEQINKLLSEPHFNELNFRITEKEVKDALRKLKLGKAVGIDNLSGEMLRCATPIIKTWLTSLFNIILLKGIYPQQWCIGIITSLHKNGDTHDPNNYRGLTITSCLGKVYNSVLTKRLEKFVENYTILPVNQIGFRKKARTSDHMFILKTLIEKYVTNRNSKPLYLCFVDLKKAYDSVWHQGLMLKLLQHNIRGPFFNSIQNMYSKSCACIKHQNGLSESFKCNIGVRQGDVLSPLLFNLYISDLPDYVGLSQDSPKLGDTHINCLMYADDMVLMSLSESDLQARIRLLEQYCQKWHLNINEKKTKVMVISKARVPSCEVYVCNTKLDQVDKYMYLGIEFTNDGKMEQAQLSIKQRCLKAIFKLRSLLQDSSVNPKLSMKLFDQMVKPIVLYGCEIWGVPTNLKIPTQGSMEKLLNKYESIPIEKMHMRYCKYAVGVHNRSTNYAILGDLGRYPISIDILRHILSFLRHVQMNESKNNILQEALNESQQIARNGGNSWFKTITTIAKTFNITPDNISRPSINHIKSKLRNCFISKWHKSLQHQNKMFTYCRVKQNFGFENYLTEVKNKDHRVAMTRMRTSAHKLMIEKGRYMKVPREDRKCTNCTLNTIEDETHVLLECPAYEVPRSKIIDKIVDICPNLRQLNKTNQIIFLLSAEGWIANLVAELCYLILK